MNVKNSYYWTKYTDLRNQNLCVNFKARIFETLIFSGYFEQPNTASELMRFDKSQSTLQMK
jgi:hypothetical protein